MLRDAGWLHHAAMAHAHTFYPPIVLRLNAIGGARVRRTKLVHIPLVATAALKTTTGEDSTPRATTVQGSVSASCMAVIL